MLTVIKSTRPKIDKALLYLNALGKKLAEPVTRDSMKQIVWLGVRYLREERQAGREKNTELWQAIADQVYYFMAQLTPREFTILFPPEKSYDGEKWQEKDYFSTMELLARMDMDQPIGWDEKLFDFLWDYQNWDVSLFLVEYLSLMDKQMRAMGKDGPMDKLIDTLGIKPYYLNKDPVTGTEYLFDPAEGRTHPVHKALPQGWRIVQ